MAAHRRAGTAAMTSDGPTALAAEVRRLRLRAGFSQEELAERAAVGATTIGALERGLRRRLYPHTASALADALGLDDAERAAFTVLATRRAGDGAPAPQATAAPAPSLPAPLTSLVGRERELTAAALLLADGARLLTLTGPGGVGKTRLALAVAERVARTYADGAAFVDLAPVADADLVPQAIGRALGVRESGGRSPAEMLAAYLRDKRLLVVLDNFEQVIVAAPLLPRLLRSAPGLTLLVTSRATLRVSGEREYAVPPLSLPDPGSVSDLASLAAAPAVALLLQRARAAPAGFALTAANAAAVAAICARLDGLPLALELAAARLRVLPPQALLARLDRRLAILTGGARDLSARQQTLRATITWSYDLLSASERTLFRRLAVFTDGCSLGAAEAVCGATGNGQSAIGSTALALLTADCSLPIAPESVLNGLESLVEKSLIRQHEDRDGEPRYIMLETIREFGLEQLAACGEEAVARRAHGEYFAAFAEHEDLHGPARGFVTRRLEADGMNLRAALVWSRAAPDGGERLMRIVAALGYFWFLQGHASEGRAWCEAALVRSDIEDHPALRARVLFGAGQLAWDQEDLVAARPLLEASVAGAREAGDTRCLARALYVLGEVLWQLGDADNARAATEEGAACAAAAGHAWELGITLQRLGMQALQAGDLAEARRHIEQSLAQFQLVDDPSPAAYIMRNLGYVALAEGRFEEAARHMSASLVANQEIGYARGVAGALAALAGLAVATGEPARAARLSGAVFAMLDQAGAATLHPRDRPFHERALAGEREALGAEGAAALHDEGRDLSLDAAVALALTGLDRPTGVRAGG